MWTREQAFWVIELLEPLLANAGAHCALNGSVLYRGSSTKDLDLIVYPHKSVIGEHWDTYPLKQLIRGFFQSNHFNDCKGASQVRDGKEVSWLTTPKGKRVDIFFLR